MGEQWRGGPWTGGGAICIACTSTPFCSGVVLDPVRHRSRGPLQRHRTGPGYHSPSRLPDAARDGRHAGRREPRPALLPDVGAVVIRRRPLAPLRRRSPAPARARSAGWIQGRPLPALGDDEGLRPDDGRLVPAEETAAAAPRRPLGWCRPGDRAGDARRRAARPRHRGAHRRGGSVRGVPVRGELAFDGVAVAGSSCPHRSSGITCTTTSDSAS